MVITREWLFRWSVGGKGDAWSRDQLLLLGLPKQPKRGWIGRIVGADLSDERRELFERASAPRQANATKSAIRSARANWLRSARRRLGLQSASKASVAAKIRTLVGAPSGGSTAALLEWYADRVRDTPVPPRTRTIHHREADARDEFLASYAWRRLRMEVIKERGRRCECCGATPADGVTAINVDHIKPRRLYPELALVKSNLQVLCGVCNHGKGNWDETDWRDAAPTVDARAAVEIERLSTGVARGAESSDWTIGDMLRPITNRRRKAIVGALGRRANALPRLVKAGGGS